MDTDSLTIVNEIISDQMSENEHLSFWDINCLQYSAAVTLLEHSGKLKECEKKRTAPKKPSWQVQAEIQISAIRRKISHITVILNCDGRDDLTKNQRKIAEKLKKLYRSLKPETLQSKLAILKHDLKVRTMKLRDDKKKSERSRINFQFKGNQKCVFRNWKGKKIEVTDPPAPESISNFWSGIWERETPVNLESQWYQKLKESYCSDVVVKKYQLTEEVFKRVLLKMPNNKAPGPDKIISYWLKSITPLHQHLLFLLQKAVLSEVEIPDWLATSMTILLPKTTETNQAKNYRPIACLNITYKLFTAILNTFLDDHCTSNDIITIEQAGGKKGSWGCVDQLLVNKMVMDIQSTTLTKSKTFTEN